MKTATIALATLFTASSVRSQATATASQGVELPSTAPILGAETVQGCFSSAGDLQFNSTPDYNTRGKCARIICAALGKTVAAITAGNQCYCGDRYPAKADRVNDTMCNSICPGYGQEACGGPDTWTVYNTGVSLGVRYLDDAAASASKTGNAQSTGAVVTVSGAVVTETVGAGANQNQSGSGGGSSAAGIAAGVVVGIVAIAGGVGGFLFYLRRRRNREIEEEHRRNAAVTSFIGTAKPPSSSGGYSITDSRLDPVVMAQRRISNGSIADNQDYSRKILRVTNA